MALALTMLFAGLSCSSKSGQILSTAAPADLGQLSDAPSGLDQSWTWTGTTVAVAGYSNGSLRGHLRVAVWSPDDRAWRDLSSPFDAETARPALGYLADGSIFVIASVCETDASIPGEDDTCLSRRLTLSVYAADSDSWQPVDVPDEAEFRGLSDSASFVLGTSGDGAFLRLEETIWELRDGRLEQRAPAPPGMPHYCATAGGLLSVSTTTLSGAQDELRLQLLGDGGWQQIDALLPPGSRTPMPSPDCSPNGVIVRLGNPQGEPPDGKYQLALFDVNRMNWAVGDLPVGVLSDLRAVAVDDNVSAIGTAVATEQKGQLPPGVRLDIRSDGSHLTISAKTLSGPSPFYLGLLTSGSSLVGVRISDPSDHYEFDAF